MPEAHAPRSALVHRLWAQWRQRVSPRTRVAVGFIVAMSAAFLLTTSRERPWTDGSYVYFTAERLIAQGTTNLDFPAVAAPNGTSQSPHPLSVSLVHVPGALLKRVWSRGWRGGESHLLVLASHVAPAVLAAWTCWLFIQLCLLMGVQRRFAIGSSLILGFGTILWVYARSPWPSVVEAFVYTGFVHAALVWLKQERDGRALALGLWAIALVNVKWSFVVLLPLAMGWLAWRVRNHEMLQRQFFQKVLPMVGLGLALVFLESKLRFGTWAFAFATLANEPMSETVVMGLWGVLFSPGKSMLIYSPPLLLGVLGARLLWRQRQFDVLALAAATLLPYLLYVAKLSHWTGDWAWGPRFCVFMTPVFFLPAALYLQHIWAKRKPLRLAFAAGLIVLGLSVQLLGNGLYWDHYIRVAKHARLSWLGVPNRSGALIAPGASDCDPCFEDIYPMTWLAPFNPIEGHAWLLGHVLKGHDAKQAEADAAWHRYTGLSFSISESYDRARVDWWLLNFLPKLPGKGIASLLALSAMLALGLRIATDASGKWGDTDA